MILRTRRWLGASMYEVTASPEQLLERLPLPTERAAIREMGFVTVQSAADVSAAGQSPDSIVRENPAWRAMP